MNYPRSKIVAAVAAFLAAAITVAAQTLYTPGGTVGSITGSNVGIGTSSPTAKLEVNQVNSSGWGGNLRALRILSPDNSYYLDLKTYVVAPGNVGYNFSPNGNIGLVVTTPGNVGIGTTAPGYRLDVLGPTASYPARVRTPEGYLLFGPANSGWSHFSTDRPRFYFNTGVTVDSGNIGSYDEDLALQTSGTTRITVSNTTGNIGIGTAAPKGKLSIQNAGASDSVNLLTFSENEDAEFYFEGGFSGTGATGNYLKLKTYWGNIPMTWRGDGHVGIGTNSPSHRLSVNGAIRAKEVIVDTGWSDFVFEDDYRLPSLDEVEEHIRNHGHLPGVPSAAEVQKNGLPVGESQKVMMQKIEELTLYLLQMKQANEDLHARVHELETRLSGESTINP